MNKATFARIISDSDSSLSFHVPPEYDGQIVTAAFACDGEHIYARVEDRSEPPGSSDRVVYRAFRASGRQIEDFDPANGTPSRGRLLAEISEIEVAS